MVFFHVPNESFTSYSYTAKLNAIGRISGAPDFVIALNGKVIFMELKNPIKNKKPKLSENQKAFQEWANMSGTPYFVVDSLQQAKHIIKQHILGVTDLASCMIIKTLNETGFECSIRNFLSRISLGFIIKSSTTPEYNSFVLS